MRQVHRFRNSVAYEVNLVTLNLRKLYVKLSMMSHDES